MSIEPRKARRGKAIRAAGAAAASILLLSGCGTSSAAIVATYNGGTVTQAQLNQQMSLVKLLNPQVTNSTAIQTQVLKNYIVTRLFEQKAAKAGIKVTSAQLQQGFFNFQQQTVTNLFNGSSSAMDAKMQQLHLTNSDLMPLVKDQLLAQSYAQKLVKPVTLSEQKKYYQQNYLNNFVKVTERSILVKTLPLAQQIASELKNGGSWKVLAKKYSLDPGSKNNGGEYVLQSPGQWVPSFQQHAMTQPIGVLGSPFHSRYGYFVMEVLQRQITPFKAAQAGIRQQVQQQQLSQSFSSLITQMQKDANIKVQLK